MIILDTHIWYWWVGDSPRLQMRQRELIEAHRADGFGVSIISCWEIAKKNQLGKLELDRPVHEWLDCALAYPGIRWLPLTPDIVVESTRLPGQFHRDPADELIVATARFHACPLLTADAKILGYPHVTLLT